MQRWEYAVFTVSTGGRSSFVSFSHQPDWRDISGVSGFWDTVRRLGDEGFELVSVRDQEGIPMVDYFFKRPQA
jgi:hypothetical protein